MYTDLRAELDDVQGGYCPGLEAAFGQLNFAFKRLTVPNAIRPDGSLPPPAAGGGEGAGPSLPWWDMMRYVTLSAHGLPGPGVIAACMHTRPSPPHTDSTRM